MDNIPSVVVNFPVVPTHSDMRLHNIIVSDTDPTKIKTIVDWELCACAPYVSLHSFLERNLFHEKNGAEYPLAIELR